MSYVNPSPAEMLAWASKIVPPAILKNTVIITKKSGPDWVFNATLIEIDQRVFLATAGHCLRNFKVADYWFLRGDPTHFEAGPRALSGFYLRSDQPDVGVLEIAPSHLDRLPGKAPIPITHIHPCGTAEDKTGFLLGAPLLPKNFPEKFMFQPIPYYCWPRKPSDWKGVESITDQKSDIICSWKYGEPIPWHLPDGTTKEHELPHPLGLSGSGFWLIGSEHVDVWTSEAIRLVGIQSACYIDDDLLHLVQIHHWIRLVYANYEGLRNTLEQTFPMLRLQDSEYPLHYGTSVVTEGF